MRMSIKKFGLAALGAMFGALVLGSPAQAANPMVPAVVLP